MKNINRSFIAASLLLASAMPAWAQQPEATMKHGFYEQPFQVSFTKVEGDTLYDKCEIRYTLDGSAPTPKSTRYVNALSISKNTLLRAAYVRADTLASPITTVTYLFMKDVLSAPDVPNGYPLEWGPYCQVWGSAKGDYGMDQELLAEPAFKNKVKEGLLALPTLSIVTDKNHFFNKTKDEETGGIYIYTGTPVGDGVGRDWVRPISVELFGGAENHDFTVDCGTKIHGGHSRLAEKSPKHSFRLMFAEKYGGPGKLKYKLFGNRGPKKYNQLVLRCMFGNTWTHWQEANRTKAQYQRDMWMRSAQEAMGHPSAKGMYVNLYLNGMYWGIYNIAERINDYYCSSNYGGEKEDYDVIKVDESHTIVPSDGDLEKWNKMESLVKSVGNTNKTTSQQAYCKLIGCDKQGVRSSNEEVLLDIDNFIDYMLLNQYGGNDDWDHHNWLAFRNRMDSTQGFRFICWDTEIIFTTNDYNAVSRFNDKCPTYIFKTLMKHEQFKHRYYDRVYKYLVAEDGLLTPNRVVALWDSLYSIIEKPLYAESARWGDYRRDVHPYQTSSNKVYRPDVQYQTERNRLLTSYFPGRTSKVLEQIKAEKYYTDVTAPVLRLNGTPVVHTDTLRYGDALKFALVGEVYYTIDGEAPVSWLIATAGKLASTSKRFKSGDNVLDAVDWNQGELTVKAITRKDLQYGPMVEWHFVLDGTSALTELPADEQDSNSSTYDLMGRRLPDSQTLPSGLYLQGGKKVLVR